MILFYGDQCGERQRRHFETDEEQKEIARRNHQVHTQQGNQREHVELAPAYRHIGGFGPSIRLYKHQQRSYIENYFYNIDNRRRLIHPAESLARYRIEKEESCLCRKEQTRYPRESTAALLRSESVIEEQDKNDCQKRQFIAHP